MMVPAPDAPDRVQVFPNGEVGLAWPGGREDYIASRLLRVSCPCAECIDEMTGVKRLEDSAVAPSVSVTEWRSVGSYAIGFTFSDGHSTGIFTFERLRALGDASE